MPYYCLIVFEVVLHLFLFENLLTNNNYIMQNKYFKTVILAVVALVSITANAQETKEIIVANKVDTTIVEQQYSGKKLVSARTTGRYTKTTTDALSLSQKEEILSGKRRGFDPEHKNLRGWDRHKYGIALLGGANFVESQFNPNITLRGFYETCHWLFEAEGTFSRQKYTEDASVSGNYYTFLGTANVGVKVWQNRLKTSYVAVLANGGYGLQKTDTEDANFYSKNYGLTAGGFVRASASLAPRVKFIGEVGWKLYPKVKHTNGVQELECSGVFANIGIAYTFRCK